MRQIIVRWVVPGAAADVLNVFNFQDAVGPDEQRDALEDFLIEYMANVGSGVVSTIETDGRMINEATGETTSFWADGRPKIQTQTGPGGPAAANATSVLMQWGTDAVIGGRRLRGRTYLPGFSTISMVDGGVAANVQGAMTAAGEALIASDVGLAIWHRPTDESPGTIAAVTSAAVWSELGVQKGRRG